MRLKALTKKLVLVLVGSMLEFDCICVYVGIGGGVYICFGLDS